MKKITSGFTIVELLIVIVVIAVLAAISIVAYNGIQNRAENSKTVQAVSAWAKAMQLYKVDKGVYPANNSCLGGTNTYTNDFNGVCWGTDTSAGAVWRVQTAFLTEMASYLGSPPEPSRINTHSATDQYRGALYYRYGVGAERVYVQLIGAKSQADCPNISGLDSSFGGVARSNGYTCYYSLPQ